LKTKIRIAADSTVKPSLSEISAYLNSESAKVTYESILEDVKELKHSDMNGWDILSREVYLLHRHPYITTADVVDEASVAANIIGLISGLAPTSS
jgi:hypothetical protein